MRQLPDRPSELLRLAVNDLEKAERSPKYEIEMGHWHFPLDDDLCTVCMAGAVMAFTLDVPHDEEYAVLSRSFDADTRGKLHALDDFRRGYVGDALRILGMHDELTTEELFSLTHWVNSHNNFSDYTNYPTEFKMYQRELANRLEQLGH